jgi:hypothetical protein
MSSTSRSAAGAHEASASGKALATATDHIFDLERLSEPGVELANADFEIRAKLLERRNAIEQIEAQLFLGGFRK